MFTNPENDLSTIIAQIREFDSGAKVDIGTDDRVSDIVEMWSLCIWQEHGMLDF